MVKVKLKTYLKNCLRVFKVTKKPGMDEYKQVVKLTSMGIAVRGILALIITIGFQILGV